MARTARQIAADDEQAAITRAAYDNAHHFTCTIQADRSYQTFRFPTLAEARAYRPTLEAWANNSRKALCYAVTHDQMTHLMPDSFQP